MRGYIVRRLLLNLVVVWIVATLVFLALRVLPGDYAAEQVALRFFTGVGDGRSADEALADARAELGLDKSIPEQYVRYISDLLSGDLGKSFVTRRSTVDEVGRALPYSLQLGVMTAVIAVLISLPVGVISAVRPGSLVDHLLRFVAIIGLAAPSFWIATMFTLLVLRFDFWRIDVVGTPGIWAEPLRSLELFAIPAVAGGLASGAILMRYIRSQLLEVLGHDYIRTARSKGLRERTVILRHAVKNALIPAITVLGFVILAVVNGSVILEAMFNIPGMGRAIVGAVQSRDFPMVQTLVVAIAVGVVTINLLIDMCYFYIDPRVSVSGSSA